MELTIAKILYTKEVQGKFGPQHNVRFTTNEMGEKSISGFFKYPLKEGQKIEGEVVEKPGTDRDGNEVVYLNFQAAKSSGGGINKDQLAADFLKLNQKLDAIMFEVRAIKTELHAENVKTAFDDSDPLEGVNPFES